MKHSVLLLFLLMSASHLWSQSWSLKIGGPYEDCIRSLCTTERGFVYFSGIEKRNSGLGKAFVGLANSEGKLQWLKKVDFNDIFTFPAILSHQEAGLLFVTRKSGLWLSKISSQGALEWQCQYEVTGDLREPKACLLADGIFVLLQLKKGKDESLALLKIDFSGELLWSKYIDAAGQQHSQDISAHPAGGAVIVSSSIPGPSFFSRVITTISRKLRLHRLRRLVQGRPVDEAFIMRINGDGQIVWQKRLVAKEDCNLNAVSVAADGSILVSGVTLSSNRNFKGTPFAMLLSASYEVQWQYFIQGSDAGAAMSNAALDKGFAIGGFRRVAKRDIDMWYCRIEKSGQLKESMRLGTKGGESQAYVARGPKNTLLIAGGMHKGEDKNIDGFLCQLDEGAKLTGLSEKATAACHSESCELRPILVDFFPLGVTKTKSTVQLEVFDYSND